MIGKFANKNYSIGHESQLFIGTGLQHKFKLSHPFTYAHEVTINNKLQTGEIYTGDYSKKAPENKGYLIIRNFDEHGKPIHSIWFKTPPDKGAKISIKYCYGKVIMFEGSSVGQTISDEINESNYGEGIGTFDPANPAVLSSGMEYRYIDRKAFWIHKFTEHKNRHFEIEIVDGINPYFIINYSSNRYHDFMNAGIGGWSLAKLLDNDNINDYNNFFKYFLPDLIVMESATNDDWAFGERKLKRTVTGLTEKQLETLWTLELDSIAHSKYTNDYSVRLCSGLITNIDDYSLNCPQIITSNLAPGDIIRIGTYWGDNRQIACREIDSVDLQKGKAIWLEPFTPERILLAETYNDLIGKECSVRDLSEYQKQYELLIQNIQKISPHTKILITQPGLSNYRMRQLWGYDIIHRRLAAKYNNVNTIEVTEYLQDFQENNITGASSLKIESNGATSYILPWNGHWQGFEVWVDNNDVYGKDCYVDCGQGYSLNMSKSEENLKFIKAYDKSNVSNKMMKLVFTKNAPQKGLIEIKKADSLWSGDFCHPNNIGAFIYGQAYIDKIKSYLK